MDALSQVMNTLLRSANPVTSSPPHKLNISPKAKPLPSTQPVPSEVQLQIQQLKDERQQLRTQLQEAAELMADIRARLGW